MKHAHYLLDAVLLAGCFYISITLAANGTDRLFTSMLTIILAAAVGHLSGRKWS